MNVDSPTARRTAMSQASHLLGRWAGDGQFHKGAALLEGRGVRLI